MNEFDEAYRKGYLTKQAGIGQWADNIAGGITSGWRKGKKIYHKAKIGHNRHNIKSFVNELEELKSNFKNLQNGSAEELTNLNRQKLLNKYIKDARKNSREFITETNKLNIEDTAKEKWWSDRKTSRQNLENAQGSGQKGFDDYNNSRKAVEDAQSKVDELKYLRDRNTNILGDDPIAIARDNQVGRYNTRITELEKELTDIKKAQGDITRKDYHNFTETSVKGGKKTSFDWKHNHKYIDDLAKRRKSIESSIREIEGQVSKLSPEAQRSYVQLREFSADIANAEANVAKMQKIVDASPFSKLDAKQIENIDKGLQGAAAKAELKQFKIQQAAVEASEKAAEKTVQVAEKETRMFKKRYIGAAALTGGVVYSMGSDQPKQTEELNKYLLK